MSSQDQINDDTDDASHYVQTLVRDHMETVMDYHRDPQPPPASHMDDAEKLFMIQVIVIALEQDKEVVLACLVKAAVDVQNRAVGEESTAVNDFLQQTQTIQERTMMRLPPCSSIHLKPYLRAQKMPTIPE
ncbi:unnamed protein product [Alternaria alternata]